MTVANGFISAYPNAFYRVSTEELPHLVAAIKSLKSENDYAELMDRFGIRRTDRGFWLHSDAVHAAYRHWAPVDAALFDYNRLENN